MARIFTVSFSFNNNTYNTMVTVKTTPYYMEYTLNNLSPELQTQLPGNKIISPSGKKFLFPNAMPNHSQTLMNTIIKAVDEHLRAVRLE